MHSERLCIERARDAKRRAASRKLQELEAERASFDLSLLGQFRVEWRPTLGGRLLQVSVLPLVLAIQAVLLLWAPIGYFNSLRDAARKKRALRQRLVELEQQDCRAEFTVEKSLAALWEMHGLPDGEFSPDERIELLSEWLDILYGKGAAARIDPPRRRAAIVRRQVDANAAYYRDEPDAPHFLFVNPIDTLVERLSAEFPLYVEGRD